MIWFKDSIESWGGSTTVNDVKILKILMPPLLVGKFLFLFEDGITDIYGDILGEHGVELLLVMDFLIFVTGNECIQDVGRGYSLVFGEDVSIVIASGGDREYVLSRGGVPFYLVHVNTNVED